MKKSVLALLLTILPLSAMASGGSSGMATPTGYEVDSWDQMVIVFGSWANPDGCTTSSYVILPMSNSAYKDILATVLAAGTSGKQVGFWVVGCTASPWGTTAPTVVDASIDF